MLARPKKELKGFQKISLEPGETRDVEINLGSRSFSYWDPADPDWPERSIRVPVAAGGRKSGPGHRAIECDARGGGRQHEGGGGGHGHVPFSHANMKLKPKDLQTH